DAELMRTPMPVPDPSRHTAPGIGTHVHCPSGAASGWPVNGGAPGHVGPPPPAPPPAPTPLVVALTVATVALVLAVVDAPPAPVRAWPPPVPCATTPTCPLLPHPAAAKAAAIAAKCHAKERMAAQGRGGQGRPQSGGFRAASRPRTG